MPYSRLFYHFVWATKDRRPLISEANREAIEATIAAKVIELGGAVHAIGGTPDHMHLVASVPPAVSVSSFIGQVKGASSHLASRLPTSEPIQAFAWQSEYGVLTVSEAQLPTIKKYVRRQREHHSEGTLSRRLEIP